MTPRSGAASWTNAENDAALRRGADVTHSRTDVGTCAAPFPSVFSSVPSSRAPASLLTTTEMAEPVKADAVAATPGLSPAASPGSEPPSTALSPTADGSQRLFFSHDLVSGRYRGSVRFGLVRMIHGEEDFNSDSDLDDGGGRGGGGGGGGRRVPGGSDTESTADAPSRPLVRGFVRVQWYPEGGKQDIRETKVPAKCLLGLGFHGAQLRDRGVFTLLRWVM